MTLKVVHVTWLDSTAGSSWTSPTEEQSPLKITHSVGFLIQETKNSIVLALSYDPETKEMNCYKHIPLVAVEKVRTLSKVNCG